MLGSQWSDPLKVVISDDTPPNNPVITGPDKIKPLLTYLFIFNATDNDTGQHLFYDIDWGNGEGVVGLGPYDSGEAVHQTHSWTLKGDYIIKARVYDGYVYSGWTTFTLKVSLSLDMVSSNSQLLHLVQQGETVGSSPSSQPLQNLILLHHQTIN